MLKKEEMGLSQAQEQAVRHREGPMMVLAGPGAGKTTVITRRLQNMVEVGRIPPEQILVITFTKVAAREMEQRYNRMQTDGTETAVIRFGTFHSVFYEWLRRWQLCRDAKLLTDDEKTACLQTFFQERLGLRDEAEETARQFLTEYDKYRNEGRNLTEISAFSCCEGDIFRAAVGYYKERKQQAGQMDYEDMQELLWEAIQKEPARLGDMQRQYRYFLVDEFQDVNPIQYAILKRWAAATGNLFVVGDEDQSIYGFRGSSPSFLLRFPEEFPGCRVVRLLENYRCSGRIVAASRRLIGHNRERYDKELRAVRPQGERVRIYSETGPEAEAIRIRDGLEWFHRRREIAYADMAVLYRTEQRRQPIRKALSDAGIPFRGREEQPDLLSHWMAAEARQILRLREKPEDAEAFRLAAERLGIPGFMIHETLRQGGDCLRALEERPALTDVQRSEAEEFAYHMRQLRQGDLPEAMQYLWQRTAYKKRLRQYAEAQRLPIKKLAQIGDRLCESARGCRTLAEWEARERPVTEEDGVLLSTMHSAKGLEFPLVWCAAVAGGILPHAQADNTEEERRVFYVGMTRARDILVLSGYGPKGETSLFLQEVEGESNYEGQ